MTKPEPQILNMFGEKPNLKHELELKVRASNRAFALIAVNKYLVKEYGFLFCMQVLEPIKEVSLGVWTVKLRAGESKSGI